jgi:pimeloyl-ACP methyl ester carboxylesterase
MSFANRVASSLGPIYDWAVCSTISWVHMTVAAFLERVRSGLPPLVGDPRKGTVFILDGVGGTRMVPTLVRKGLQEAGLPYATYVYDWHHGPPGEILGDLMCMRRNQLEGARLARVIRRLARENPSAPIHMVAYSGGTGVAVWAVERLGGRTRIETLVLGCPALSPGYDLGPALRNVGRCYVLSSHRDWIMLGLGTSLFGTIDRQRGPSVGLVGLRMCNRRDTPDSPHDAKLTQIWWTREMRQYGHYGHHVGFATRRFVRHRIAPLFCPVASE